MYPVSLLDYKTMPANIWMVLHEKRKADRSGNSCHHCKSHKEIDELLFCASVNYNNARLDIANCKTGDHRACRKKFCHFCLRRYYMELFCYPDGISRKARIFNLTSYNNTESTTDTKINVLASVVDNAHREKKWEIVADQSFIHLDGSPFSLKPLINTPVLTEANEIISYPVEYCDSLGMHEWICPACRDICKCSQCRKARSLRNSTDLDQDSSKENSSYQKKQKSIIDRNSISSTDHRRLSIEDNSVKRRSQQEILDHLHMRKYIKIPKPERVIETNQLSAMKEEQYEFFQRNAEFVYLPKPKYPDQN